MRKRLMKGFTLVELMIVVAIIGILSAIAIPNFIRFQARSKQAEAKTNMKAIFTGQKSRFADKDRYSMQLGEIGFSPERGNRYRYDLGESASGTVAAFAGAVVCMSLEDRMAAVAVSGLCGVAADEFRYTANINPTVLTSISTIAWTANVNGAPDLAASSIGVVYADCPMCDFAAGAVGNVDNDSSADVWVVSSQNGFVMGSACAEATPPNQTEHPGSAITIYNDVSCDEM